MKLRDIAAASRMAGGGGSGPVSWNDLTDKPFYHEIQEQVYLVYTGFGYYQGRVWQQLQNPESSEHMNRFMEFFGTGTVSGEYLAVWENSVSGEKVEWVVTMTRRMTFTNEAGEIVISYDRKFLMTGPNTTEELAPYWALKFCQRQEVLKTIDEKFLPVNSGGASSWNDLTDKPFYEETKDVTLIENFTSADYEANDYYAPYIDLKSGFCTIIWNGRAYENIYASTDDYGSYLFINEDELYLEIWAGGSNEVTYINTHDDTFVFSIYQTQHNIKPLDEKFLPFHTNAPILGDVLLGGMFETIEETAEGYNYSIKYSYANPHDLGYGTQPYDGEIFRIVFNGTVYDLPYKQTYSSYGYIGARDLFTEQNYPFSIWTGGPGSTYSSISFSEPGPHELTVYRFVQPEVVIPIEDKYIPDTVARKSDLVQSDWDMIYDDEASHIKNRSHYKDHRYNGESLSATITAKCSTSSRHDDYLGYYYSGSGTATVTKNSSTFTLTNYLGKRQEYVVKNPESREEWWGIQVKKSTKYTGAYYIGNGRLVGNQTYDQFELDIPFAILYYPDSDKYTLHYEYGGQRTLEIYHKSRNVYQLSEEYIPDTIARQSAIEELMARIEALEAQLQA